VAKSYPRSWATRWLTWGRRNTLDIHTFVHVMLEVVSALVTGGCHDRSPIHRTYDYG